MATMVNDRVDDPSEADVDYYVGLEHLDSESLTIRRWGSPSDVEATKLRFRAGDIIFGRRRVYQRKLAVADFDGICSAHAMVLRAKSAVALPELLPFFMQSDVFMERAKEISVGSLSPTINWKTLAKEEFALPPLDEQHRLLRALKSIEDALNGTRSVSSVAKHLLRSSMDTVLRLHSIHDIGGAASSRWEVRSLENLVSTNRTISYGILKPGAPDPTGVPMLRVMDFDDFGRRTETQVVHVARSVAETSRSTYLRSGDVLVSVMATIGRCFLVGKEMEGWNVNRALAVLPFDRDNVGAYVESCLQSAHFQEQLQLARIGSAQPRINLEFLKKVNIPFPPADVREMVIDLRCSLDRAIAGTEDRVQRLKEIKATFLSNAFGG